MFTSPRAVAQAPAAHMRHRVTVLLLLAVTALLACGAARAAAADLPVATQPAGNAVVTQTPHRIAVSTGAPVEAAGSSIALFGSDHRAVETGAAERSPGRPDELTAAVVPDLDSGVYTVVWRAAPRDGSAAREGSFAFSVDPDGASPALVAQERPHDSLTPAGRAIPRFLAFVGIMLFVGALALRFLVTAPAAAKAAAERAEGRDEPTLLAALDRRLLLLAGAAIALFVFATLGQLANEAADPEAGLSFWQSIRPGDMATFVTDTLDGHLWGIRLLLTLVAAVVTIPAAVGAMRGGWQHRPERVQRIMLAGLLAGTGELIFRVVPAEKPEEWVRDIFTAVLDWGHMFAASVWIGGLAGLVVLAATLRVTAPQRGRFWPIALRRFSLVATVCVGAMILTGLWTAFIHLGPPRLLFHTLYGETLLVKLILLLLLVGCGAINQLWLVPKIHAARERGEEGSGFSIAIRHFRRVVALEAVLGILILLVVPFLSGSARKQEFVARASDLTQTQQVGGQAISLRPSGVQPGATDYDVTVPGGGSGGEEGGDSGGGAGSAGRVTVAFGSRDLGVPTTSVLATSLGGGRYRVSGLYTPMVGDWQVQVDAGQAQPAAFELGVSAEPLDPGRPDAPKVTGTTWVWGIAEVLVVLALLAGGWFTGSRMTERRMRE